MTETIASSDDGTLDWRDFLTDRPPGTRTPVDRAAYVPKYGGAIINVCVPELQVYCDGTCQCIAYCNGGTKATGKLFGGSDREPFLKPSRPTDDMPYDAVLCYACEKCGRVVKRYAVRFWSIAEIG